MGESILYWDFLDWGINLSNVCTFLVDYDDDFLAVDQLLPSAHLLHLPLLYHGAATAHVGQQHRRFTADA